MAFSKTPMESTEQTKRIPLFYKWNTRNSSNTYDTDALNVIIEPTAQNEVHIMKRDGISEYVLSPAPTGVILGSHYVTKLVTQDEYLIVVTTTGVYQYTPSSGVQINFVALASAAGRPALVFEDFLYDNGTVEVFFVLAGLLYRTQLGGTTTAVVTGYSDHGNRPVFLDGYLFLSRKQGDIVNSALNDPLTWPASGFISAESYSDKLMDIARVGTYLVAFGQDSTQYFYDAGNPTGTPLAPVQGATKRVGLFGGSCPYGDMIYFLGSAGGSMPALYRLDGLNLEKVSDFPANRKIWQGRVEIAPSQELVPAGIMNFNGHTMYVWRFYSIVTSQTDDNVYMFDLDVKEWTRLAYQGTNTFPLLGSTIINYGYRKICLVMLYGDTKLYFIDSTVYQDNGVNFTVQFRTGTADFGTQRMKFGSRLVLACDQTPTTSNCAVSWTDDDYQTYSTPRNIDVSNRYKQMYALGSFRSRAFRLTYSDNFPMRWEGIELDYTQGQV